MIRRAALVVVALLGAAALPAAAQTDVDVSVANGGPRTLYIEDMLGNELESLDINGASTLPFRVRVVDDSFDHEGFTVSATMTNLYLDEDGLDFDTQIDSDDLEIVNPLNPLDVLDVETVVQPVIAGVEVTGLVACGLLGFVATATCSLDLTELVDPLEAKLVEVEALVDLLDLTNLPLIPQMAEPGEFTHPDWVAAQEPDGAPPATPRTLLSADPGDVGDLLPELDAALALLDADDIIDPNVLAGAVHELLGATLTAVQATTVLAATTIDVEPLTANEVLYQSGTYTSFPMLRITVPSDKPNGTYRGTLVVTGIES